MLTGRQGGLPSAQEILVKIPPLQSGKKMKYLIAKGGMCRKMGWMTEKGYYRGLERGSGVLESEKLQFRMFSDLREMFICSEEMTTMRHRN